MTSITDTRPAETRQQEQLYEGPVTRLAREKTLRDRFLAQGLRPAYVHEIAMLERLGARRSHTEDLRPEMLKAERAGWPAN